MDQLISIASKIGFPTNVVHSLMSKGVHESVDVATEIKSLISSFTKDVHFLLPRQLMEQYISSDCYLLAEYLVYLLHDDFADVSYVHLIDRVSIHALVRVTLAEKVAFIDAAGVYTSIEAVISRYGLKLNEVTVSYQQSSDIIENGNNDGISKLSNLTFTREFAYQVGDATGWGSGDFEDELMNRLVSQCLSSISN